MVLFLERYHWVSVFIAVAIALIIFYVSSLSFSGVASGTGITALIYHFGIFFLFEFYLLAALIGGYRRNLLIFPVLIGILYGISDELHQFLVPGRYFSLNDILIDSVGVFMAFAIYGILLEVRKL